MNKVLVFLTFLSFNHHLLATEKTEDCHLKQSQTLDKNNQSLVSCDAAKIALLSDAEGDKAYRRNLNKKLAESLALQTKQILEELAAGSSYYEQGKQDFLLNDDVKNYCRFEVFKEIEKSGCNLKSATPEEKEKIKIFTDALGKYTSHPQSNLLESVANIYAANKYGSKGEAKSCPLKNSDYPLSVIVTEGMAEKIIENARNADARVLAQLDYIQYPQLAMIINAEKSNPGLKDKFENYLKNYDSKIPAKDYLMDFFYKDENKPALGSGVAQRCSQLQSSVTSFICSDVKNLASKNPSISKKLFNGYNPRKDYQDQKAEVKNDPHSFKTYAYLCMDQQNSSQAEGVNESKGAANVCQNIKQAAFNTVDNWYGCFSEGIRLEQHEETKKSKINTFCDLYLCQDKKVKNLPSCQSGGVVNSADLRSLYHSDEASAHYLIFSDFVEKLEKNAQKATELERLANLGEGQNSSVEIKKSLSSFDLNAFGVESVNKFLGLSDSPKTIALVAQEMKERGIEPITKEQIHRMVNNNDYSPEPPPVAQQFHQQQVPIQASQTLAHVQPLASAKTSSFTKIKRAPSSLSRTPSTATSANPDTEEMKREVQALRDEVIKRQQDEKKTIEEAVVKKEDPKNNSYEKDLKGWSNRLNRKENELSQREMEQWSRERELMRRQAEINAREQELFNRFSEPRPEGRSIAQLSANGASAIDKKTSGDQAQAKLLKERETLQVKSNGLTVSPERLEQLEKNDLTELGVNIDEPFIIRVLLKGKMISVKVSKIDKGNGRSYLAPSINEDSKEIREVILKSPIFKEFRYYLDQHSAVYSPLKKAK